MSSLKDNLNLIQQNLVSRKSEAKIIAVCKKQSISRIKEVLSLGVSNLGINYLNEYIEFKSHLGAYDICWHYIGSIQSNKLNKIVGQFKFIHSVGKFKTIEKIDQLSQKLGIVQKILLQINLSGEITKSGFTLLEYRDAISKINKLKNINLCGLMTMPPLNSGSRYFKELLELKKEFELKEQSSFNCDIKYLSMGTSGDYDEAIKYGATHIRLGTVLMGQRG